MCSDEMTVNLEHLGKMLSRSKWTIQVPDPSGYAVQAWLEVSFPVRAQRLFVLGLLSFDTDVFEVAEVLGFRHPARINGEQHTTLYRLPPRSKLIEHTDSKGGIFWTTECRAFQGRGAKDFQSARCRNPFDAVVAAWDWYRYERA